MKITWTFYPRYEPKVTLSITYIPLMDNTSIYGFLHEESNSAWVSWDCFKVFHNGELKAKKDAFERLTRIECPADTPEKIQSLLK